jgi:endonuclease/exonuclease/phosphatase family metal-dependent hydrolase
METLAAIAYRFQRGATTMNRLRTALLHAFVLTALSLAGCAETRWQPTHSPEKTATLAVTVMTFNVENLFDNIDDPVKDDKAYLPLSAKQTAAHRKACNEIEVQRWRAECLNLDWNDDILDYKMTVIAETILQVNDGRGADIIALQEVENLAVLEQLRTGHLADAGYLPAILIEGTDARGIDVAFLSRLPLVGEPVLHPLKLPDFPERERDTRGVLQADFQLPDGSILTGFSVHFPAPFHPTEMRVAAYRHLNGLLATLPDNQHAFAGGDFNTTRSEDAEKRLLDTWARPGWTLAHDIGCQDCNGTHYYARGDDWSFLDMILFAGTRGGNTTAAIRADSVQIANDHPAQVMSNGTPLRFDADRRQGVSDHWPMIATIELTQKQ